MTDEWSLPGGPPGPDDPSGSPGVRDPRLGLFASGGKLDRGLPAGHVLVTLESLAAPRGRGAVPFAGSTHNEDAGMLAAVTAVESHAAAIKLALVRQIIRRHAPAVPGGGLPSPDAWGVDLSHDVAAILRISWQAAPAVIDLAWNLGARLPGTGDLLDRGVLTYFTAKIICDEFSVLDGGQVREAERRLLEHDLGADDMTPSAIRRLCQRIACEVDPHGTAARREKKERDEARLKFWVDHGGTMGVFGSGLPADQALMADKHIQARALEYKAAGIREKIDVLRVQAWLDLANGVALAWRLAQWRAGQAERERTGAEDPGRRAWEQEQRHNEYADRHRNRHGDPDVPFPDTEPEDLDDRFPGDHDGGGNDRGGNDGGGEGGGDGAGSDGPGGGSGPRGGGPGSGPVAGPADRPAPGLPSLVNLTIPLATVLGQAARPGEAPGFGVLDPGLAGKLANAAADSPRSKFCVTFTSPEGYALAHGCARLIRGKRDARGTRVTKRKPRGGRGAGQPGGSGGTRDGPSGLDGKGSSGSRDGPAGTGWEFTRDTTRPGPEGGYGAWILMLPTGARYRVDVHKIPVHDCDHALETDAYRPSALLRHLVEVRDGVCTFVCCSYPARLSDFEHAIPYHKGGRTDACNGGMRSRRCHRVKQSRGWRVTQPKPGWHRWQSPSGRSYTKGPRPYPA